MQFNRAFDRTIEIQIAEATEKPGFKTGRARIQDPVHVMELLARIDSKGNIRDLPEGTFLAIMLLQLYRQTHRAILSWGSTRSTEVDTPERAQAYDGLVKLIRRGEADTVQCGAFQGAGVRRNETA